MKSQRMKEELIDAGITIGILFAVICAIGYAPHIIGTDAGRICTRINPQKEALAQCMMVFKEHPQRFDAYAKAAKAKRKAHLASLVD